MTECVLMEMAGSRFFQIVEDTEGIVELCKKIRWWHDKHYTKIALNVVGKEFPFFYPICEVTRWDQVIFETLAMDQGEIPCKPFVEWDVALIVIDGGVPKRSSGKTLVAPHGLAPNIHEQRWVGSLYIQS